jgi:hypothetical protein
MEQVSEEVVKERLELLRSLGATTLVTNLEGDYRDYPASPWIPLAPGTVDHDLVMHSHHACLQATADRFRKVRLIKQAERMERAIFAHLATDLIRVGPAAFPPPPKVGKDRSAERQ